MKKVRKTVIPAIQRLNELQDIYAQYEGDRINAGKYLGLVLTNVEVALRIFRKMLKELRVFFMKINFCSNNGGNDNGSVENRD